MLLLLQPGTETQVPSKLFEYIALGKPILAISPREGATSKLVTEECLGMTAEAESVDAIASVMERLYRDWAHGAMPLGSNGRGREKFNVKTVTAHFSAETKPTRRLSAQIHIPATPLSGAIAKG